MKAFDMLRYAVYVLVELVKGSFALGRDIATPGLSVDPAIVELPLRCATDAEIARIRKLVPYDVELYEIAREKLRLQLAAAA